MPEIKKPEHDEDLSWVDNQMAKVNYHFRKINQFLGEGVLRQANVVRVVSPLGAFAFFSWAMRISPNLSAAPPDTAIHNFWVALVVISIIAGVVCTLASFAYWWGVD